MKWVGRIVITALLIAVAWASVPAAQAQSSGALELLEEARNLESDLTDQGRMDTEVRSQNKPARTSLYISSYAISYKLSQDAEKRSVLETHETIVAEFPERNINRGIERFIPHQYKGHSTSLKIQSIKDETGAPLEYSTRTENDTTVVRIGDPDTFMHGAKTYQITYTQRDVTHYFENTGAIEWYWDTNGVGWKVPIDSLSIAISVDSSLHPQQRDTPRCYKGRQGATDTCQLTLEDGVYKVSAEGLAAGENITVAFGFAPDTFAAYQMSFLEKFLSIWKWALLATSALALGLLIVLLVMYSRRKDRKKELHTIPVEYIPPREVSVITASQLMTPLGSVISAQLIDFAVRHYIEIIETKPKKVWTAAEYDIKVIKDLFTLRAEEREIITDMFGAVPAVGQRIALKTLRHNYGYATRTLDNDSKLKALIEGEYSLRSSEAPEAERAYFKRWMATLLILALLTLSPPLLIVALVAAGLGKAIRPFTDKGLAVRRYLMGLEKYIKAAEKERIKMLQGPDTAEKVGYAVDANDPSQLVKLYERTLPYAIFFGHEAEWSKRLAYFYEQTQQSPDWYGSSGAFNAATFTSAMASFAYAASPVSGSSASSSTGGSSGGGSSGGGGGGGGGGGW